MNNLPLDTNYIHEQGERDNHDVSTMENTERQEISTEDTADKKNLETIDLFDTASKKMQQFTNSDFTYNANRSNESEIPDLSKNEETSQDIHHVQQTKDYLNKTNTIENTNN